jgi:hypothetical protein
MTALPCSLNDSSLTREALFKLRDLPISFGEVVA